MTDSTERPTTPLFANDCPDSLVLSQWLRGQLDDAMIDAIETHIPDCDACQERLDRMTDEPRMPRNTNSPTQLFSSTENYTDEPQFQRLKEQVLKNEIGNSPLDSGWKDGSGFLFSLTSNQANSELDQGFQLEIDQRDRPTEKVNPEATRNSEAGVPNQDAGTINREADQTKDHDGATNRQSPGDSLPQIDGFRIESVLGQGGFSKVFLAWDEALSLQVAIKVLDANRIDSRSRQRFFREAKVVAQLDNPNIVRVYRFGETEHGQPYLVMEYIAGGTIEHFTQERFASGLTRDTIEDAVRIISDAAHGLTAVHDLGLVHRDIKPANILVYNGNAEKSNARSREDSSDSQLGRRLKAKIADFGLVKFLANESITLTRAAEIVGTPAFMSPEQAQENLEADHRSDVYSLGATLYFSITGQPPFRGSSLAVLKQIAYSDPIPPGRLNELVPTSLETICLKALSKEPNRRYQTASSFADDLTRFLHQEPISAKPVSRLERFGVWCSRNAALATTLILLALSLLAGTVTSTVMWRHSENNAAESARLADSLKDNRKKLRRSVNSFQSKVFSSEAIHWQMTKQFRQEMFQDVIQYLDEFSELDVEDSNNETNSAGGDALASDYLEVADAAFQVLEFEQAKTAAARAFDRGEKLTSGPSKRVAQDWHAFAQAAIMLGRSELAIGDIEPEKIIEIFSRGEAAAQLAVELAERMEIDTKSEMALTLIMASYRAQSLRELTAQTRTASPSGAARHQHKMLRLGQTAFDALSQLDFQESGADFNIEIEEKRLLVGYDMLDFIEDEDFETFANELGEVIKRLRNERRVAGREIYPSDRTRGKIEKKLAEFFWENGKAEEALTWIETAEQSYVRALKPVPQNRVWRAEQIDIQTIRTEYLVLEQQFSKAKEVNLGAIRNAIAIIGSDPKDIEGRKEVIRQLVTGGELSVILDDHDGAWRDLNTAAQDCRLLVNADKETKHWSFSVRQWLLPIAMEHAPLSYDKARAHLWDEANRKWLDSIPETYPDEDQQRAIAIYDGEVDAERPEGLGAPISASVE